VLAAWLAGMTIAPTSRLRAFRAIGGVRSLSGAGHFSVKADEIFGTRGARDLLLASDLEQAAVIADARRHARRH
jgi:hypothetical protein